MAKSGWAAWRAKGGGKGVKKAAATKRKLYGGKTSSAMKAAKRGSAAGFRGPMWKYAAAVNRVNNARADRAFAKKYKRK